MAKDTPLNWKLILFLSMFGLAMAFATVWVIPSNIEPVFWFAIFLVCAFVISRRVEGRYFLHGFLVSLVNCVWITSAHIVFFEQYLATHAQEAEMMKSMPLPDSPRLMMAMTGPVVGIVSGIVLGIFSVIAAKLSKRK